MEETAKRVSDRLAHAKEVQREQFDMYRLADYAYHVKAQDNESKLRDPETFGNIETSVVRIVGKNPEFTIKAKKNTPQGNAEAATHLYYEWQEKANLYDLNNRQQRRTLRHGTAITQVYWKTLKREVDNYVFDDTGLPVVDPSSFIVNEETGLLEQSDDPKFLTETVEVVDYDDPAIKLLDNYSLYVDPEADSLDDMRWIVYVYKATKDELESHGKRYKNLSKLEENGNELFDEFYQASKDDASGKMLASIDDDETVTRYNIAEMWERRDDGKIYVVSVCGDVVMEDRKSPYWYPGFPFVEWYDVRSDDSFFGIGEFSPIAANQALLDTYAQVDNEAKLKLLDPPMKTWGDVDDNELSGEPGSIVHLGIKGEGMDVEYMSIPDFTGTISNARSEIRNVNKAALGTYDYAKGGDAGSGNDTATGVTSVIEQANIRFKHKTDQYQASHRKLAQIVISMYQQYMTEERQVEVLGENGAKKMVNILPKQIAGMFAYEVVDGSTKPKSMAAERDAAMQQYEVARMLFPQDPSFQAALALNVVKKIGDSSGIEKAIQQALDSYNVQAQG